MISKEAPLILASRSPRRRALLEQIRIPVEVRATDAEEIARADERAHDYLERVVSAKIGEALARVESGRAVLAADTEVVLDDRVLGKPRDDAHAKELLRSLAGRSHDVMTRFAIGSRERNVIAARTVVTRVVFRALSEAEIAGYVASGEGSDKAGAYAIQGLGAFAVERIEGSYSNVVGLPLAEVVVELVGAGLVRSFPLDAGAA